MTKIHCFSTDYGEFSFKIEAGPCDKVGQKEGRGIELQNERQRNRRVLSEDFHRKLLREREASEGGRGSRDGGER